MNSAEADFKNVESFSIQLHALTSSKPSFGKQRIEEIAKLGLAAVSNYKHVVMHLEKFIWKTTSKYKLIGIYILDALLCASKHKYKGKDKFRVRFAVNLFKTIKNVLNNVSDKKKVVRVVKLWEAKKIFDKSVLAPIYKYCEDIGIDPETIDIKSKNNGSNGNRRRSNSSMSIEDEPTTSNNDTQQDMNMDTSIVDVPPPPAEPVRSESEERKIEERRKLDLPEVIKLNHMLIYSRTVVVKKLTQTIREDQIVERLKSYGNVEKVMLIIKRGCAYVTFKTREEALQCLGKRREVKIDKKYASLEWAVGKEIQKDPKLLNYWNKDKGFGEIPHAVLPHDIDTLFEGNLIDPITLPGNLKNLFDERGRLPFEPPMMPPPITHIPPPPSVNHGNPIRMGSQDVSPYTFIPPPIIPPPTVLPQSLNPFPLGNQQMPMNTQHLFFGNNPMINQALAHMANQQGNGFSNLN
uniref:CID domain-containing protein n=1 Tax=Strongyloides papillosus TaxID=174720 RepID=A0A0N5B9G3_STREA